MKNKTLPIVGIVVLVLIVIGGLVYWQTSAKKDRKTSSTSSSSSSEATSNSIQGISASGKAQKCTMKYSGNNGSGTGTIYTDGQGQGRYIFNAETTKGNSGEINQIVKDGTSYAWFESNGKTMGFKTKVNTSATASTSSSTSGPDLNTKFDMQCQAWTVDATQFTIPSDVNFIDAAALSPTP